MLVLTTWISIKIWLSLQDKSHHVTAHHAKCAIFILQPFVSLAYDTFASSSVLVLLITMWSWVCYIIIFRVYLTFVKAVLIILKHATFLRVSMPPDKALAQAELDYQQANVDSDIQEHLTAFSTEISVERFASFILATNFGLYFGICLNIISSVF